MSYGLQAPNWFDTSWTNAGGSGGDIATQTADNSTGTDSWGGFFQNLAGTALQYAIAKDSAQTSAPATGQPVVYVQSQPQQAQGVQQVPPIILLGGLGLLAYMALK